MSSVTDNLDLIEAAKKNDECAWEKLLNHYKKLIWSVISKYHFKYRDGEDVFQDISLKLVSSIKNYNSGQSRFSTFLSIISNNICIDILRKENLEIFMITEESLRSMELTELPDKIIHQLVTVANLEYTGKARFLDVLREILGKEKTEEYSAIVLKHAKRYRDRHPQTSINGEELELLGRKPNIIDKIQLNDILSELPADIRELLIYRYKGYSYDEIAILIDKDYHWVKNNLNRHPVLVNLKRNFNTLDDKVQKR